MQRLVKCCLRAALSSAVLKLPARGLRALHVDTVRWFGVLQRADIELLLEML
jgi:hypothetical protein